MSVSETTAAESLEALLARLEVERLEADRLYGDALTALDRALQQTPAMPDPPPEYDEQQIDPINRAWDILPSGAPLLDGSLKGRLRAFVWRLVGPALEQQKGFNAAVVDHLNRNLAAHREAARAVTTLMAVTREHIEGLVRFQHLLIRYLQTITLYVDTKDRASTGQAQVLNAAIGALSDDWMKRWASLSAREQRFNARFTVVDELRETISLAQQTSLTLKREVERLMGVWASGSPGGREQEQARMRPADAPADSRTPGLQDSRASLDDFKYVGFEDRFRGSAEDIRARLEAYLPLFAGQADVLDVGCGRGEFLELLRARGIPARGLDLNHEMVEVCRARGLEVAEGDVLSYLGALPDASLGGVFAAQVIEHLEPSVMMRMIETAFHKLRPGGVIVLETINPACWVAFFESYIRDLTHVRPIHPETLQYLLRASGFQQVRINYASPIADADRLQPVSRPPADASPDIIELAETFNENVRKLNGRIFTYQDYAGIGRK